MDIGTGTEWRRRVLMTIGISGRRNAEFGDNPTPLYSLDIKMLAVELLGYGY